MNHVIIQYIVIVFDDDDEDSHTSLSLSNTEKNWKVYEQPGVNCRKSKPSNSCQPANPMLCEGVLCGDQVPGLTTLVVVVVVAQLQGNFSPWGIKVKTN